MALKWLPVLILLWCGSMVQAKVGESAENFVLDSITGQQLSLNDFRGQVILLYFWTTDSKDCKKELPELVRLQDTYRRNGFMIYAISVDQELKQVQLFLSNDHVKLVTLLDPERKVARSYDVKKIPTTVLVDRNGNLRYIHKGFSYSKIEKLEAEIIELLKETKAAPPISISRGDSSETQ